MLQGALEEHRYKTLLEHSSSNKNSTPGRKVNAAR